MRKKLNMPIQLISCCSTLGEMKPLWFRFEDDARQLITVKIEDILDTKENHYNGIHEFVYTCEATVGEEQRLFELKYNIHAHKWMMFQILH